MINLWCLRLQTEPNKSPPRCNPASGCPAPHWGLQPFTQSSNGPTGQQSLGPPAGRRFKGHKKQHSAHRRQRLQRTSPHEYDAVSQSRSVHHRSMSAAAFCSLPQNLTPDNTGLRFTPWKPPCAHCRLPAHLNKFLWSFQQSYSQSRSSQWFFSHRERKMKIQTIHSSCYKHHLSENRHLKCQKLK